jgi:tRNA threonylcarbamoyladenosine biosynthesis protein TsaB
MSCAFVSIQGTYNKIELALFDAAIRADTLSKSDIKASSHLIPLLDSLLQKNKLSLCDLTFIAVDKGPGAFTSLRVTIATVNGLAFARRLPLIGVNSLEALVYHVAPSIPQLDERPRMLVGLLNAYNNDVYYLFAPQQSTPWTGCKKIDDVIADLAAKAAEYQIWLAGNGVTVHRDQVTRELGDRVRLVEPFVEVCSASAIGQLAYQQWTAGQGMVEQVTPLYLKTQLFAVKK